MTISSQDTVPVDTMEAKCLELEKKYFYGWWEHLQLGRIKMDGEEYKSWCFGQLLSEVEKNLSLFGNISLSV